MPFRLSHRADGDLLRIAEESARLFGNDQARRYAVKLRRTFELIAGNPMIARERAEIDPPVRAHPCGSHMIIYRIEDDDVLIIRVRHGREDWASDPAGA